MALSIPVAVTAWGVVSALAIATLGVFTLRGGRGRPRGAAAFGLFALLWGLQIGVIHVANLAMDPVFAERVYVAVLVLLIALPFFLMEFALSQIDARERAWRLARYAAIGALGVNAAIFLLSPASLYEGVRVLSDRLPPAWGPLHFYTVTAPFFLAFAAALVMLQKAKESAPTARTADRAALVLAGLGIYVGFAGGNNFAFYLGFTLAGFTDLATGAVLFGVVSAVTIWVAVRALAAARRAAVASEARRDRLVAAALLVPLAYGAVEGLLALETFPRLETVGVWRLAGVAVLAYGIARWRSYDLPQRTRGAVATATGATAAVAGGAIAYGAGAVALGGAAIPAVIGVAVLGASLFPALGFARRLFGIDRRRPQREVEAALYGQRIDSYRAALEASIARDSLAEDREFLAALRERFGITGEEEKLLLHLASTSVVVARDRQAWDAFERLRLLGEGGAGRTWLARDRARDRLVVLKEPLERWQREPALRDAVLREARLAAKVRHPNVVAIEEVVEGKSSPIIVLEYLEGGSLADLLRAKGTLAWSEARDLLVDVLRGLEAIHAAGIVHRDIKPSNVLLSAEGNAKVSDFGIAVGRAESEAKRTIILDAQASTIAGTISYMAPEARAGAPPDPRADLYACAAVLHEMIYGAPPGLPSPTVVRRDVPAELPNLLSRALSEQPAARPASARAFAESLARLS